MPSRQRVGHALESVGDVRAFAMEGLDLALHDIFDLMRIVLLMDTMRR